MIDSHGIQQRYSRIKHILIWLSLAAILLNIVVVIGGLWQWSSELENYKAAAGKRIRVQNHLAEITEYNRQKSMMALMTLETGDSSYEDIYHKIAPKLSRSLASISDTLSQDDETAAVNKLIRMQATQTQIEIQDFVLIHQGKTQEANDLLYNNKYIQLKLDFSAGIKKIKSLVSSNFITDGQSINDTEHMAFVAFGLANFILVAFWGFGTIAVYRWASERQAVEVALTNARSEAEQANSAKSNFLSIMSHEIRTPMNGIIGMIDTLYLTSLKDNQIDMVNLISESAYALLGIINDILDFSKLEAGKLEVEMSPMQMADCVERACILLDYLAKKKNVELKLFIDPRIPEVLLGDALRLRQVLLNIINNAIKFSGGRQQTGEVSVRALLTQHRPEQVTVDIQVTDNGIGMDEASQSKIFQYFGQADVSTTRRFGGSGLGLPIAKELIELMGGRIAVQSTLGMGTTVTLQIPFTPLPKQATPSMATDIAGLSCFVIGGPDVFADDLATYLEAAGAAVERIPTLAEAEERARTMPPGLMVWVFDSAVAGPSLVEVRDTAHALTGFDIRLVRLDRGNRRTPRQEDKDLVMVDGNVLGRKTFLKAVAIAAGLVEQSIETAKTDGQGVQPEKMSRQEALHKGKLILVVEDNEINQQVIIQQLTQIGLVADIAGDGRDAYNRWKQTDYVLVLTDLHMPEMDGYALAAAIRAEENGVKRTPIIAYSASGLREEAQQASTAGIDECLRKPVSLDTLRITLNKWLAAITPSHGSNASLTMNTNSVPVNVSVLKELVGDDPSIIDQFLKEFRIFATKTAAEVKSAYENGLAAQVGALMHKLKSSALSVGALTLGNLCNDIESAAKTDHIDAMTDQIRRFEVEIAAVCGYLDSL